MRPDAVKAANAAVALLQALNNLYNDQQFCMTTLTPVERLSALEIAKKAVESTQ